MHKNANTDSDSNNGNKNNNRASHKVVWAIVGAGILGVVVILFVSIFWPNMTERTKFFTANAVSALLLDVIIVQAYIYRRQWEVMERQVKVAERSIQFANDTFDVGEAPYFGITEMSFMDFNPGQWPRLIITFVNGGRTPAWHFDSKPEIVFGDSPQAGDRFQCKPYSRIDSRFAVPNIPITIEYQGTVDPVQERIDCLLKKKTKLFVVTTISYRDRTGKRHCKSIVRVDMPGADGRKLCDYDIDDNKP